MNVLVCIKRVPGTSAVVTLTDDAMGVDTRHVGYTVSPHEECAVEAAVQLVEAHGGAATVLTVGPQEAVEQLREALAMGVGSAAHVVAETGSFGPADVARAIADVVGARAASGAGVDLVLLGNDAADTGDFQVGIRLAYRLGWPVVTGVRSFEVSSVDGSARVAAAGDGPDGVEHFDLPLPAVLTVKEGGITPRYPSIPGRLKAKRAPVEAGPAAFEPAGSGRVRLHLPVEQPSAVQVLGQGADAAPALVDVLERIGVVAK
jgi:electron transfer flavoprotein beta subunit